MKIELENVKPAEIEARSFEIITEELKDTVLVPGTEDIVKRCIHTSADFDYASSLVFSEGAVERALEALRNGACIVTDTNMGKAGINKTELAKYGGEVYCFMADEDVAAQAKEQGTTRAVAAMEKAAKLNKPLIFAIGNAPTALIHLYEMIEEGRISPELVIGVPVGFVNVVQSKELIMQTKVPYIVAEGRKGGSNIAACICNALLYRLRAEKQQKKAILVVSFGTSHEDTRKRTIEAIEEEVRNTFSEYAVYRAWTSGIIRKKIRERDGLAVMSVTEAMEQMKKDGITDVIVQPTHVINGVENDKMIEDANAYKNVFQSIRFGNPLLTTAEDNKAVIQAVAREYSDLAEGEALVLMGHGTTHYANSVYAALDYEFKDRGYGNVFLGTVEAYPSLESIFRMLKEGGYRKVCLAPFMIVAGDHAKNDLSGDDLDSWYSRFAERGYEVRCELKGLGEIAGVRKVIVEHIYEVI